MNRILREFNYNNSLNEVKNIQKDKNEITKQIIYFDFDKSSLNKISLNEIKIFLDNYKNEINEYNHKAPGIL